MILESYKDCFDIRIKKETYEKLRGIIYFEEEDRIRVENNIQELCEKIENTTCIHNIVIDDVNNGYEIHYTVYNNKYVIYCYTLSEVIIHLKRLKENRR